MAHAQTRLDVAAVGFDFDHTLGIDNKLERVAFLRLLETACTQGGTCLGSLAEEIERIDDLLARQRSGEFSIEAAVEHFVHERGADPAGYMEHYKQLCLHMVADFVIPEPGVREMLAALRARAVPYAILTNGWSPLQQRKAQRTGFDGPLVVSSDIGVQKPDAAAFQALAETLGAEPSRIAFVGDTPASDVAGAIAAGMHGVWFDAESVVYPKGIPAPTAVIHSLAELAALV
ncbi:MAG TPA: HAD family hydrolase [Candidatus Baltobacteraceae bacterium]|nr:HAD family hydrolase [Candidatus Baltobacteraceae bacterium]